MFKTDISNLQSLFKAISKKSKLYIPTDGETGADYRLYTEGTELSLALNTNRSPKDFFFPQTEGLMDFLTDGKKISIIDIRKECEDFVLFGVRGCDVKSIEVLDRVFLSEPVDSFYKNRRDHCTVVSLACTRPAPTCFCQTFGIDPASPDGDVVCYIDSDVLYLDPKTEKGTLLTDSVSHLLTPCDETAAEAQKQLIKERLAALPLAGLSADSFGKGKTEEFFDAPQWKELSESCLGCGTCTYVCPTCQCYDIKDFDTGHGIKRFRCWDSCMFSDFTKMSAGQPRLTQLERFRQRFMHKLVYYPTNNDGLFSCVGCGRCVSKCPVNQNIVKVMKKLGGKSNDGN